MTVIKDFVEFYQHLDKDSVKQLSKLYHDDITLIDPVSTYRGLPALKQYFASLLSNTGSCGFIIDDISQVDDRLFVSWQMNFSHPKLNAGSPLLVQGMSRILVKNNKIVYQHDYYDLGSMVYEHLPLIGWVVRYLKRKLAG